MKLKLDVTRDNKTHEFMLHLQLDVGGEMEGNYIMPIGDDLRYAFYKGLTFEFKHLDCVLNEFGKEARARAEALQAQEALNGPKEQAEDTQGSVDANAADQVCPS